MGVGPLHSIDEVAEGNEVMEKRERQEGITAEQAKGRTLRWQPLLPNLRRVNETARRSGQTRFTIAASRRCRRARKGIPEAETRSQSWGRWGDGGGVRAGAGEQPSASARPGSQRAILARAGAPLIHPEK